MIRCHKCGTDNLDGSEFCDECGIGLGEAGPARRPGSPPLAPPPPSFSYENSSPRPATPYNPPSTPPSSGRSNGGHNPSGAVTGGGRRVRIVQPEPGSGALPPRARLVILRGGKVGKEFLLFESDALIGRWDADGGIFPDVDLDQDDPEAKVSRRHARLLQVNNQFLIEDLGSTNGTFINRGPRLTAGIRQPLNHGDEIIVGKTFLKFFLG
ncbi:MAG: FHA domain-containing protein [Acidobacteria bacterium]|nr:FHA domain-containing protein [Acidobacteriota bacterium]